MKRRLRQTGTLLAMLLITGLTVSGNAQQCSPNLPTVGKPWVGQKGIVETVDQIMSRDNGEIYLGPPRFTGSEANEEESSREHVRPRPGAPNIGQWPPPLPQALSGGSNGKGGHNTGPLNPQTVGTNFIGPDLASAGFIPPDTMGDIGPTQILVCINGRIRVYDKAGALGPLNVTTDSFFASVRNGTSVSDPFVRFDKTSNRWFVSGFNLSTPNRILLAVSSGPTITGAASFTFFQFVHDAVGTTPNSDTGGFADYVSMGVDANAVYLGDNVFNAAGTAFLGTSGFVVRKSSVLGAGPIVVTAFRGMASGGGAGPYSPRGVDNWDPTATQGYFFGVDNASFSTLSMRRVLTPGGTPTISANIQITVNVPATVFPQNTPCLGSSNPLSAIDDRIYQARIFKNRLTGVSTLWAAHHIEVNASGAASGTGNRNGSRWYQIGTLTGTPAVIQAGTVFDPAASNPNNYWFPSVAMSEQGHAALACSAAGAARRAEIVTCGRFESDSPGTMQALTTVQTSSTSYNIGLQNGAYRWGDYSATNVDPTDGMTMWSFQEYCNANNSWAVRVFKLIAPPPATVTGLAPNTISQGATTNIVVTGSVVNGSGWFDTEPGMNRIAAAFSGTGLTVNSITFTNPTSITLNVTASGAATVGARNLTITNPDGQQLTANGVLTVAASNNPVPAITTLSPNTKQANTAGFTLTVNGSNFIGSSVVRWNGSDRTTTFVNATQLTASITAADILTSGTRSVTVFNPAPGGGTSNTATFTVSTGAPIAVAPGSIVTTIGFEFAGGLTEILTSNNAYYEAFNDDVSLICQVEVQSNSAPAVGSSGNVTFNWETRVGRPGLIQTVSMYRHTTGLYVDVAGGAAPTVDTAGTFAMTVAPQNFVSGGNVRARVTWQPVNDEDAANDGWLHSVDLATWTISP